MKMEDLRQELETALKQEKLTTMDIKYTDEDLKKYYDAHLAEIKEDESLKRIPVVILTVSSAEEDIVKTYNLHANCYITKPIDLNQFMKVVRSVEDFWLTIVKLPNGDH